MKRNKYIYVLVNVSYDYYTFERFITASTNKQKLIDYINNSKEKDLPIYEYDCFVEEPELKANETSHWWIKTIKE
jgi:hypothetical protein